MTSTKAVTPNEAPELYQLVLGESWSKVVQRLNAEPDEVRYVDPKNNMTALHLAVKARNSLKCTARMTAIRSLLVANPGAACVAAEESGFTPLAYACMVTDENPRRLEDDREIVRLIRKHNPKSFKVLTKEGHSPLDLHIMSVSKVKKQDDIFSLQQSPTKGSSKSSSSAAVLKALLEEDYTGGLAKPLELLFECNSLAVLENVALEEAQASSSKLLARRRARSSGASVSSGSVYSSGSTSFAHFWVWQWALILLRREHKRKYMHDKTTPSFQAMHAAAQVLDCPLPFLMLAMRAFPMQVRAPDPTTGNYPLHIVAGWKASDPSSVYRKSMALSALVSEFREATKIRNKQGKTPLSLALESGTSWDNGVRRLTTVPKQPSFVVRTPGALSVDDNRSNSLD